MSQGSRPWSDSDWGGWGQRGLWSGGSGVGAVAGHATSPLGPGQGCLLLGAVPVGMGPLAQRVPGSLEPRLHVPSDPGLGGRNGSSAHRVGCLSPEDVGGTEHPLLRTEGGKTLLPRASSASSEVSLGL